MKPWTQIVSSRNPMDKIEENCPVRAVHGIGIMVIEKNKNSLYVKAAKYGIPWWGHAGIVADKIVQHENRMSGLPLCDICDGTGNAMYSMYQTCLKCHGRGVIVEVKA